MARTKRDPSETQRSIERPLAGLAGLSGLHDDGESILGTPRVDPPGFLSSRVSVRKAYKLLMGGAFVLSESGRCSQVPETTSGGFAGGSASMENVPRASRKDGRDAVVAARGALIAARSPPRG